MRRLLMRYRSKPDW